MIGIPLSHAYSFDTIINPVSPVDQALTPSSINSKVSPWESVACLGHMATKRLKSSIVIQSPVNPVPLS